MKTHWLRSEVERELEDNHQLDNGDGQGSSIIGCIGGWQGGRMISWRQAGNLNRKTLVRRRGAVEGRWRGRHATEEGRKRRDYGSYKEAIYSNSLFI